MHLPAHSSVLSDGDFLRQQPALHLARDLHLLLGAPFRLHALGHFFRQRDAAHGNPCLARHRSQQALVAGRIRLFGEPGAKHDPSLQLALAGATNRHQALRLQRLQLCAVRFFGSHLHGPARSASIAIASAFGDRVIASAGGLPAYAKNCPAPFFRYTNIELGMQGIPNVLLQQRSQILAGGDVQSLRGKVFQNLLRIVGATEERTVQPRPNSAMDLCSSGNQQHTKHRTDGNRSL